MFYAAEANSNSCARKMAARISGLFLLAVLWFSMKYCHHLNVSEVSELDS